MNLKNIIKTLFFITIITIVVSSFNVYATGDEEIDGDLPTVLLLADFEEAQEQEGETTLKGITYRGGDFYMNAGNYILGGDIVFDSEWADYIEFPEGDSVLDLNGHTIGLSILVYQHGEIESSLTINGNGTVNSSVISADSGSITINGGTYHGVLNVGYDATMTINNATVNIIGDETDLDEIDPAIFASDGAVLVINDGTFTTKGYTALWADVYDSEPAKSIEINGGTFTGNYYGIDAEACEYVEINDGTFVGTQMSGINIGDCDSVDINGGEFKGAMTGLELNSTTAVVSLTGGTFTSLDGYHSADGLITSGILLLSVGENEEAFDELLVDGYKYDPEIEVACAPTRLADEETGEPCYMPYTNQATISVIKDIDDEDEENPEEQDDDGEEDSEEKVIELVEFTISNPEAGTNVTIEETAYSTIQKPQPTVKISSDAEYQIPALNGAIVTYWVTSDSKEDDEWFEGEFIEGEKYIAEVCLIAKSGYRFSKDVEVIVNGEKVSNFYLMGTDEEGLSSTLTIFHSLEAEVEKEISDIGDVKPNGTTDKSTENKYKILEEPNEPHIIGSGIDYVVKTNGDVTNLVKINVDDNQLDKNNGIIEVGSTILTLKSEFLDTLSIGTHKLSFVYNDGEVSTYFKVAKADDESLIEEKNEEENKTPSEAKESTNPQTGDSGIIMCLNTIIIALLGIIATAIIKYKQLNIRKH